MLIEVHLEDIVFSDFVLKSVDVIIKSISLLPKERQDEFKVSFFVDTETKNLVVKTGKKEIFRIFPENWEYVQ